MAILQQDQESRFRAYLQYCGTLSHYFSNFAPYGLFQEVVQSSTFNTIQGGRAVELERIGELLRNAWMTEVLTHLAAKIPNYALYSNLWLPVQIYYSIYLELRALFLAMGHSVSHDHSHTLRAIANDIEARHDLYPYPWKLLCNGNPAVKLETYINLPAKVRIEAVNPLRPPHRVDFVNSFAMFLRTTRGRLLEARCDDWKRQHHAKKISAQERHQLAERLAPTSFFDCLYRLRLRSNYADADSFLLTLHLTEAANAFGQSLRDIGWNTAMLLELLVCRYLSRRSYENIVTQFCEYEHSGAAKETVLSRFTLLREWCR